MNRGLKVTGVAVAAVGIFALGAFTGVLNRNAPQAVLSEQVVEPAVDQNAISKQTTVTTPLEKSKQALSSLTLAEKERDNWKNSKGLDSNGELLWELEGDSYTEYYSQTGVFKTQTTFHKGASEHCKSPMADCYVMSRKRFDSTGRLVEEFSSALAAKELSGVRKVFDISSVEGGIEREQKVTAGVVVSERLKRFKSEPPVEHVIAEPVRVVYRRDKRTPVTTRGWVYDTKKQLRFFYTKIGEKYQSARAYDSSGKVVFDRSCDVPGDCEVSDSSKKVESVGL